jgi:hypothetical protein
MRLRRLNRRAAFGVGALAVALIAIAMESSPRVYADDDSSSASASPAVQNAVKEVLQGRDIFRFDTFGDEDFWGGTLNLHQAVQQLSPTAVLGLGLKIDSNALPGDLRQKLANGKVNLNDPAVTLSLLKLNAVLGVTGFFSPEGSLSSIGIQCALCHSTVDDSLAPGVGRRLDGWPNRDLRIGDIIAAAPNLTPLVEQQSVVHPGITADAIRSVLKSWGPGKFDAELFLDGKFVNSATMGLPPGGVTATLIPAAFGLGGVALHTWTAWGSVPHWNAFVATLEMHGKGRFWDPRLNNAAQFPIAAQFGFGHLPAIDPDTDLVTKKLAPLQLYQLSIPSPQPARGSFDAAAAKRGDALFSGKAQCNNCHVEPLWTDAGWNAHSPSEVCIESFQADRAPNHVYRTSPIGALFTHSKGGFYHDGRFPALMDVVNHYDSCMNLGLALGEKSDLIEYLKSLTF